MAKREIKCVIDEDNLVLTWTAEGEETLVLNMEKVSSGNQTYAALHGMKQRVTDAAALDRGASVAEKFAEMRALVGHYESGDVPWNRPGGGGGGFRLDEGLVVACVASVLFGGDVEKANAAIDNIARKRDVSRAEAIKAFYNTADVKPEYASRAAKRSAKVDAAGLVAEAMES